MTTRVRVGLWVLGATGLAAVVFWSWRPDLPRRQMWHDGPVLRYDPIEDDPAVFSKLSAAEAEAMREYKQLPLEQRRGGMYGIKQRILWEKYGIRWRTPAELNRGWAFD